MFWTLFTHYLSCTYRPQLVLRTMAGLWPIVRMQWLQAVTYRSVKRYRFFHVTAVSIVKRPLLILLSHSLLCTGWWFYCHHLVLHYQLFLRCTTALVPLLPLPCRKCLSFVSQAVPPIPSAPPPSPPPSPTSCPRSVLPVDTCHPPSSLPAPPRCRSRWLAFPLSPAPRSYVTTPSSAASAPIYLRAALATAVPWRIQWSRAYDSARTLASTPMRCCTQRLHCWRDRTSLRMWALAYRWGSDRRSWSYWRIHDTTGCP